MNSRQLWNSHQRHKLLRAKASRDILKFRVLEMAFQGIFKADAMLFYQNTRKTGNNAIEMLQAFHDIAQFKRFTVCLNMCSMLFKTGTRMLYNIILFDGANVW